MHVDSAINVKIRSAETAGISSDDESSSFAWTSDTMTVKRIHGYAYLRDSRAAIMHILLIFLTAFSMWKSSTSDGESGTSSFLSIYHCGV